MRSLDFSGDSEALDNGYSIMKRDVDPPPSRRYRSLGGKNEKEDVASRGVAFGRLSRRRMRNASRHGGRYTEPRESLEKGSLRIGRDSDGMLAKFLEGGCTSFVRSLEAASLPVL